MSSPPSTTRIGAHVSIAGGIDNAVSRQRDVGGNCGQVFTHSPQVWKQPPIEAERAERFREKSSRELDGPWVIHASYLVNLATPKDDLREKSISSLGKELDAAEELGIEYVNVHLGAHTGAGVEAGLENAASVIDELDIPDGVTLLVESDAGSGTKLGGDFAHLEAVLDRTTADVGVCLDTAHTFAAGYDLSTPDGVADAIEAFDTVVGLDHLECIHLNDSKHPCGSNADEHAHIGEGEIGDAGMQAIVTHETIGTLPLILETPTEDDRSYAWNVERVRELRGERD
ncbi:endonuclease IV [Halobacteriales archaeon QH_6_64_20]|jgi:deoxyribonuclease-4|nr:MAG: endonuclease IV [Halobacteriales archaeon QH_6_64_20]